MKLERAKKHDDEGNAYEFVVKQKNIGKYKRRAVLFYLACVALVIGWFIFGVVTKLWWLLCLIPLSVWIFYYFVHPFVSVEYKYTLESNALTHSLLYGERLEGKLFTLPIREFESICPLTDGYRGIIAEFSPDVIYQGVSSMDAEDIYFATFRDASGRKCVYYFEATGKALKTLRYYNEKTVVTDVKR